MTREEAIKVLSSYDVNGVWADVDGKPYNAEEQAEAFDMAIEALKNKSRPFGDCSKCIHTYGTLGCCTTVSNEWVYDCEHGMEQYKSTKAEPSEDGTLEVKVEDATKIGRVLIADDEHRGGLYYPDEDEPKGDDLISRAEAIEHFMRLSEDESLTPYTQMLMVGVSNEIKKLPSADRPRGEWVPCKLVNQCYIPELADCKDKPYLVTYETETGKRFVKKTNIYHGRIQSKENRIIAWMPLPEPYKGGDDK